MVKFGFRHAAIAAMLLAGTGLSFASGPDTASSVDPKITEGIRYHNLARTEPEGNIEKGKEILGPLQKKFSLAKAYYGSLITLEAGVYAKNKNGLKALALLSEGTGLIDEAVKADPDFAEIHFLRMENSYEVSEASPLNRYKIMKKDIDWLTEREAGFEPVNRGILYLYTGYYNLKARKMDAALAAFDACIAVSPGSPEAAAAEKQKARYAE